MVRLIWQGWQLQSAGSPIPSCELCNVVHAKAWATCLLERRAQREAGFTEQRKPPAHGSGRITSRCYTNPICLMDVDGIQIGPLASGSKFLYSYPQGLQKLLEFIKNEYRDPKIYITENGITEERDDKLGLDEALKDPHRIQYILQHLYRIKMAIK
ncbi:hypothetical protein GBA52_017234 [Prunus armeniaca]|nr:hypothetical protein GBA52_017234 [Prunus armeniaca]